MTGNFRTRRRAALGAHRVKATGRRREWNTWNVGRTVTDFQSRSAAINRFVPARPTDPSVPRIVAKTLAGR